MKACPLACGGRRPNTHIVCRECWGKLTSEERSVLYSGTRGEIMQLIFDLLKDERFDRKEQS